MIFIGPLKIVLFVLLSFATGAWAGSLSASDWLKKSYLAARQLDYSGVYIYQSGSYVETSRVTHLFKDGVEFEKLEGLNGEKSEVIRRNNVIWCSRGNGDVIVTKRDSTRTFPALLPEQSALLEQSYQIRTGESERVAGLQSYSILLKPKDGMRYGHKVWVHKDSGLLLKAVVLDEHEHVIEQYAFTQLDIGGNIDHKWIQSDKLTAHEKQIEQAEEKKLPELLPAQVNSGWVVYVLPSGFRKTVEMNRIFGDGSEPVTHMAYSDGLVGISIFIERLAEKSASKHGLYSNGVLNVYTKVIGDHHLTVVGEVPSHTLVQVAESVKYKGHKQ